MSTATKNPTATHTQEAPATGQKGLAKGQVGLLGTVAIGVGCIAPAYTLTSSLGPTIAEVGIHVPAVLILGFIPVLLVAIGYRELNARVPDSGTSFTWATKAFGPTIGWMSGWGLITATIIVLSNLAAVAVDFLFILLSQIFQNPGISDLTRNLWINIPATLAFIAVAAWLSYRGLTETRVVQYVLVGIQLAVLTGFAIVAVVQTANGTSFDPTPISTEWFNPTGLNSVSMAVAGISLSIFMFWGWDTTLTMNEETKDP